MSLRDDYVVEQITYNEAAELVVAKHYLHRMGPCSLAFGLFNKRKSSQPLGVITYGTPSSAPLRRGLAGDEHTHNVMELTRLWVSDNVPRNGESFLIGNTLKRCPKEFIVSFADTAQSHLGTVYQATNWLYTGLSAKRTDWTVVGVDRHGQTLADKHSAEEMRVLYGSKFSLKPRSRKHRYVYINAPKQRRKYLLSRLRYPILPYPKNPVEERSAA